MKVSFENQCSKSVKLYHDRAGGAVELNPKAKAIVTLHGDDDHAVRVDLYDEHLAIWNERTSIEVVPKPDPTSAVFPYDEYGVLVDPAEAQQQVMLGLYDIQSDASDAEFSQELLAELDRVRLRFMDEFEATFPGHGKGRALWR